MLSHYQYHQYQKEYEQGICMWTYRDLLPIIEDREPPRGKQSMGVRYLLIRTYFMQNVKYNHNCLNNNKHKISVCTMHNGTKNDFFVLKQQSDFHSLSLSTEVIK
jgi:hypothetical protein